MLSVQVTGIMDRPDSPTRRKMHNFLNHACPVRVQNENYALNKKLRMDFEFYKDE